MQNLITNKVTISSLPISPEAYNFHCTRSIQSLSSNAVLDIDG